MSDEVFAMGEIVATIIVLFGKKKNKWLGVMLMAIFLAIRLFS